MNSEHSEHKRQWRDYQTENGARPIKDFLLALPMKIVLPSLKKWSMYASTVKQ